MNKRIAESILSLCAADGADAAEVYLRASTSMTIEVKERRVEAFERARDRGAGIRVQVGQRMGFAYTTELSGPALRSAVVSALASARSVAPDPFHALPHRPTGPASTAVIHDPAIVAVSDREKIEQVLMMEAEAFGLDQRVRRIRKASGTYSESETLIMSSLGVETSYAATAVSASIEVVAEDKGEAQAGWEYDVKRFLREMDTASVGRRAARKSLDLLGARPIASVKAPVILDASVAQEFLDILRSGFSAESVQKGKSLFAGKLGTEVASPLVTVYDDGTLAGGIGSAPEDDEGVPTRKKTVIDQGRLALFLSNTRTARKDGTASTGNAVRGGFKGTPGVGVTNLFIAPGATTPEDLIASTGRGLFVNEVMGAHTANAISGDFSVGATGFWIENGARAYPVREITIAGNIIDVMRNIDTVCSDLRFSGRIGSPSIRIGELSISGT